MAKRDDRWIDSDSLWVTYRELTAEECRRVSDIAVKLTNARLWFQLSPQPPKGWRLIVKKEDVAKLEKILPPIPPAPAAGG